MVAFRRHTLLPLDDCPYALQPLIAHLKRSSLHRCFQRHTVPSTIPSRAERAAGVPAVPEISGRARPGRKHCRQCASGGRRSVRGYRRGPVHFVGLGVEVVFAERLQASEHFIDLGLLADEGSECVRPVPRTGGGTGLTLVPARSSWRGVLIMVVRVGLPWLR